MVLISLRILWQPSCQRQKLIGAIEKHDVLRFVAGSVRGAIHPLGANVALASFNLDEFRANFKSEDGAKNVLSPMDGVLNRKVDDGALNRKRKASQINKLL